MNNGKQDCVNDPEAGAASRILVQGPTLDPIWFQEMATMSDPCMSILNRTCQHPWNCDFEVPKFRWASYNDQFALNNRRCFFLIDFGQSGNDDVPVLAYE
ncbi:uncharacterized protein HRG_11054 [Hirsutella rhossiliensis]|uniref:Uncharacterized protein n=1 Tax=Hirsutella rhossiliensis TaxID=111463 RepID=A0A9P8SCV4_9HYPO|nr:uncharacterized protein HRG_11054 [Hirsutella rhossiliensis]KAH0957961.1 hypothetical protein HRG_11054 [Hirsutella rhossiliensis]